MLWTSLIVLLAPWLASTLLTDLGTVRGADDQCLNACSDWSVVLGHCSGLYHNATLQRDYSYSNTYVACLCQGDTDNGAIGNETINTNAGICLSCDTTPKVVKKNLQDLLSLCAIQAQNGTAANATFYSPVGYSTSQDTSKNGESQTSGQDRSAAGLGLRWVWAAGVGIGSVVLGLAVLG